MRIPIEIKSIFSIINYTNQLGFCSENFLFFSAEVYIYVDFLRDLSMFMWTSREFSLAIQCGFCLRLTFTLPSQGAGGGSGWGLGDVVVTTW